MFCPNCGHSNPDGSDFCMSCGRSMSSAEAPASEQPQQTYQTSQQPNYNYDPGYTVNTSAVSKPTNSFGIIALVCGILGLVAAIIPLPIIGIGIRILKIVVSVVAIIFGVKGKRFAEEHDGSGTGISKAGFTLGIIAVIIVVLSLIITVFLASYILQLISKYLPDLYDLIYSFIGELPSFAEMF